MSVKYSQVKRARSSHVTFFEPMKNDVDVLHTSRMSRHVKRRFTLSIVRHVMKDEPCDIIPVVQGLYFLRNVDSWGASLLAEVTYSKRGYRATYGGRFNNVTNEIEWTCYMD